MSRGPHPLSPQPYPHSGAREPGTFSPQGRGQGEGWRRRFRAGRHVTFTIGFVITLALLATAVVSLVYTPRDPLEMSIGIGVGLGMLSGYFGGWLDEGFMRLMDAVQGFPAILSALLMAAVFRPSLAISMVAIGVAFLPVFARLTRASFLEFRDREFVLAARALGAGDGALIVRHILPNTLPPLIVQATISFPVAILAEAALSYLGLGTQPPHPSWGLMLKESQAFLGMNPWYAVFPGGAIAVTVLGLNLLGDGLRDLLDPKLSG